MPNHHQNRQNVVISPGEKKALSRAGIDTESLGFPAAGVVLSDREQAFVSAYVQMGGDRTGAARRAGFPHPPQDAAALMRKPGILAAIKREQALAVSGLVVMADKVLSDILGDEEAGAKVRIAAARVAYERGGVLKKAALDAAKEAAGLGDLSSMGVPELERTIADAAARIAQAERDRRAVTLSPGPDGSFSPVHNAETSG